MRDDQAQNKWHAMHSAPVMRQHSLTVEVLHDCVLTASADEGRLLTRHATHLRLGCLWCGAHSGPLWLLLDCDVVKLAYVLWNCTKCLPLIVLWVHLLCCLPCFRINCLEWPAGCFCF